jgi:hypothetical protein
VSVVFVVLTQEQVARSHSNVFEVSMVVGLVRHMIRQGYQQKQIAVLTPYAGQLLMLRKMLTESHMAVHIDQRTLRDLEKELGNADFGAVFCCHLSPCVFFVLELTHGVFSCDRKLRIGCK